MVWRIGEILDFDAQVEWVRQAGFEAVSFHASAGTAGKWRGIDPAAAGQARRRELREALSPFSMREVHAPFALAVGPDGTPAIVDKLESVIALAADVGASIVTVHAQPPSTEAGPAAGWQNSLERLDRLGESAGLRIGFELTAEFDSLMHPRRPNIGVTLDVGHMYLDGGAPLQPYGSIGQAVRDLANLIFHLHVHDYDGRHDHIEAGTGVVDFNGLVQALSDIKYMGAMCLELTPSLVEPEGIRRSAEFLREKWS